MADILIKNMEMPESEDIVLLVRPNGDVRKITRFKLLEFEGSAKAVALPSHGDLIDRGLVQEVLAQLLPLVITNELTDKEIGLVHRTVGAIAEMINEQEVVVEATE